MSPELLTNILNIVLYVLIGLIVLKTLFGLFKGMWKSLTSFIVSTILYVLIIVFNTKIATLCYQINLSSLNAVVSVNGSSINVVTIGQTIRDVIITLSGNNIDLTPSSEIFKVCDSLAISVISLVVFILDFILVAFIISPIISFLIYHLIVKNILGNSFTKKHKVRVGGLVFGGVKAVVTSCLLLTPFTALANNVTSTINKYDFDLNSSAEILKSYSEAYENSYLAKIFSSVKINGTSIDISLTDYLTSFKLGEDTTSLMKELSTFVNIACAGIEEGAIDISNFTYDYAKLLSKGFVTTALIELASSSLVTTLLPVAMSIVVNIDQIKDNIDLTEIEWNEIDWSDELNALSDIYQQFYDTGIIEDFVFDLMDFNEYSLTRENYTAFYNTFNNIEKSSVLTEVMPYLMVSLANYLNNTPLNGLLSNNVNDYKNIDFGNELQSLYDTVLNLSDLATYSSLSRPLKIGDLSNQENLKKVLDFALSENAVNGLNSEGEKMYTSTSNDVNKVCELKTSSLFDGIVENNTHYLGILDSELLLDNVDVIISYAVNNEALKEYELDSVITEIAQDIHSKEEWSREINSLLNIVPVIYNNPDLPLDNFDIKNETQVNELRKMTPFIDSSKIVSGIIDPLFQKMMGDKELFYGVYGRDLDFSVDNVGYELDKVLAIIPTLNDITDAFSGGIDAVLDPNTLNFTEVENVLNTVVSSKIINPQTSGVTNFETLLINLFKDNTLVDAGFNISRDTILSVKEQGNGSYLDNWTNEIGFICDAFSTLQNSDTIKTVINNPQTIELSDINGDEIENIIVSFNSSSIIASTIGDVLNHNLSSALESMNLNIDFNVVDDWDMEAHSLNLVLTSIKQLDEKGIDFKNFNIAAIESSDIDVLSSTLKDISKLQSIALKFDENGNRVQSDAFADFVYQNVTSVAFKDYINDTNKETIIEDHKKAFSSDNCENEIDNLMNAVDYLISAKQINDEGVEIDEKVFIKTENGISTLTFENLFNNSKYINDLLLKINDIDSYRTMLGDVIDITIKQNANKVVVDGLDITTINSKAFNTILADEDRSVEKQMRANEINKLSEALGEIFILNDDLLNDFSLSKIDTENIDRINILLKRMQQSKMFNTLADGKEYTFFGDVMSFMLVKSTLATSMNNQGISDKQYALKAINAIPNSEWNNEIDLLCNALLSGKNLAPVLENNNTSSEELLNDIQGEDLSTFVIDYSKSKILNYDNALGRVLNDKLSSLIDYEQVGLKLDFELVQDWNQEANNLGKLIDDLKTINVDGKVTFNFDVVNLNPEGLENTLLDVVSLVAVNGVNEDDQGNTIDNFGNFIYTSVTKKIFSDFINSSNEQLIKNDHNLNLNYVYDEKNNVFWNKNADDNDKYQGEITSLINLVKTAQNNLVVDGNFDFSLINEGGDVLHDVLTSSNDVFAFRTIISTILKDQVKTASTIKLGDIDFTHIYFELFDNEYNFTNKEAISGHKSEVNNRFEEIDARQSEIDILCNIVDKARLIEENLGDNPQISQFSGVLDDVEIVLTEMNRSRFFNTLPLIEGVKYTVFEETMAFMMKQSTLNKLIYNAKYDVGYDESSKVYKLINDIRTDDNLHWDGTDGEIVKFINIVRTLANTSFTSDDGSIHQFEDFSQVLKLSKDNLSSILYSTNDSYLSHDALSNLVDEIFIQSGISSFALDGNVIDGHRIDENDNYSYQEKVEQWRNNEIPNLLALFENIAGGIDSIFVTDENGNVKAGIFSEILPHLFSLENLRHSEGDVFIGFIYKVELADYIIEFDGSKSLYSDKETTLATKLRKRDTIQDLVDTYILDYEDWSYEANKLDSLINVVIDNKDVSLISTSQSISGDVLKSLIENSYEYDESVSISDNYYEVRYHRAYIASEVVSSFLYKLSLEVDNTFASKVDFRRYDNSHYTYLGINRFEADGYKGYIDFVKNLSDFMANFQNDAFNYENFVKVYNDSKILLGSIENKEERFVYLNGYNSNAGDALFTVTMNSTFGSTINVLINGYNVKLQTQGQTSIPNVNWNYVGETDAYEINANEWFKSFEDMYNKREYLK